MGDGDKRSGDDRQIERDLLAKQAEFFEAYFRKGAEFARELLSENERLRTRLAELEEELARGAEARSKELEQRFREIERENNDLAALYVAQSQLHSTLRAPEVMQILCEVLINFVGASRFAVYLLTKDGKPRPMVSEGIDLQSAKTVPNELTQTIERGAVSLGQIPSPGAGSPDGAPVCCFALVGNEVFGGVAIWRFLPQKKSIDPIDGQLLELLSRSGGLALEAARVASQRKSDARTTSDDAFEVFSALLA